MEKKFSEKLFSDKLYGNMNHSTIDNITLGSSAGLVIAAIVLRNINPTVCAISCALSLGITAYRVGNIIVNGHFRSYIEDREDYREVRGIYDGIIINYNKLNRIFDLNEPVEINTMFNYNVYKGYLSKNKTFVFSDKNVRDKIGLLGANIINGKGVCRHMAPMLKDIFTDYGINSSVLIVKIPKYIYDNTVDRDDVKQIIEEMPEFGKKYIKDYEQRKIFNEVLNYGKPSLLRRLADVRDIIEEVIGNHVITLAVKDDEISILDATKNIVYKLQQNNLNFTIGSQTAQAKIRYACLWIYESLEDIRQIKSNISLPSSLVREDQLMIKRTTELCENNQDILEQFYADNSEMYNELSNKLMLIKK